MKEEKERNEVVEVSIACECQGKENGEDDEAMHSLLLWRETERERERERGFVFVVLLTMFLGMWCAECVYVCGTNG